jgi:Family of unknown function (DUF6491)
MKAIPASLLASALLAASAGAFAATAPQATIPFMNLHESIHAWQADGQHGLWIQDVRKKWYYAKLQAPCDGLEFAPQLAFDTPTNNTLDRFSSVIVPNKARCQINSLTASEAPADEKKSRKPAAAPPAKAK